MRYARLLPSSSRHRHALALALRRHLQRLLQESLSAKGAATAELAEAAQTTHRSNRRREDWNNKSMKISISGEELAERVKVSRFGKQLDELMALAASHTPIALSAQVIEDGRRIAVIYPVELKPASSDRHALVFVPVWCRCYLVYDAQTKNLKFVTAVFEHGQFSFDYQGERPTSFTTDGAGVGDRATRRAEAMAGYLLSAEAGKPPVRHLIAHIRAHFAVDTSAAA